MSGSTALRLVQATTPARRARGSAHENPVINVTLQVDDRRVLTVPEAAYRLGISRSKLYQFIAASEIRTIHIGRLCKVPVEAIDDFLASRSTNRVGSHPPATTQVAPHLQA